MEVMVIAHPRSQNSTIIGANARDDAFAIDRLRS
jgi:hypothetical protein